MHDLATHMTHETKVGVIKHFFGLQPIPNYKQRLWARNFVLYVLMQRSRAIAILVSVCQGAFAPACLCADDTSDYQKFADRTA